eukprot:363592-Chlamydomonas_euryale.AAC.6
MIASSQLGDGHSHWESEASRATVDNALGVVTASVGVRQPRCRCKSGESQRGGGWMGGFCQMTRRTALHTAAAAAEAAAAGAWPQPCMGGQQRSPGAGSKHARGTVAAAVARRPLPRASALGGLAAVR